MRKKVAQRCRKCGWIKIMTPLGPECGCTY